MVQYLTPILHTLAHWWYIFEKKGILWYVKRVCKMSKKSHYKAPINKGYFKVCSNIPQMVQCLTPILHTLAHVWYIFEKKGILGYVKRMCKMSKKSHYKAPINKGYFGVCSNIPQMVQYLKSFLFLNLIQDHIVKKIATFVTVHCFFTLKMYWL